MTQLVFYADCCGSSGHWSEPIEVTDADLSDGLIGIARVMLPRREMTVRELELWGDVMRPAAWGTSKMTDALVERVTRHEAEGISHTSSIAMAEFVLGDALVPSGSGNES